MPHVRLAEDFTQACPGSESHFDIVMKKTSWEQQTVTKEKNKYISLTQCYMDSGNSCDHSLRHGCQTQFLTYQENRLLGNKYFSDSLLSSSYSTLILGKQLHTLNLLFLELVVNKSKLFSCLVIRIIEKAHNWGAGESFLSKGHGFSVSQCPVQGTTDLPQWLQAQAPPLCIHTWTMQKYFSKRSVFTME